jgi:hypothetical protein
MGNERPESRHNSTPTKVTLDWIDDAIALIGLVALTGTVNCHGNRKAFICACFLMRI